MRMRRLRSPFRGRWSQWVSSAFVLAITCSNLLCVLHSELATRANIPTANCGQTVALNANGAYGISSPNYPNNYPTNY